MLGKSPENSFAYLCKPSLVFAKLRRSGPVYNFCPSHLPFGDACILPLSLSYDPLPPQNLASHNLVSRRQSVVVLTVKMVHYYYCYCNCNYYCHCHCYCCCCCCCFCCCCCCYYYCYCYPTNSYELIILLILLENFALKIKPDGQTKTVDIASSNSKFRFKTQLKPVKNQHFLKLVFQNSVTFIHLRKR